MAAHDGWVLRLEFSSDSCYLASSGTDGTAVIWDVAARRPMSAPVTMAVNAWAIHGITPGRRRLYAVGSTGRAVVLDTDPGAWASRACAVAGRTLTGSSGRSYTASSLLRRT